MAEAEPEASQPKVKVLRRTSTPSTSRLMQNYNTQQLNTLPLLLSSLTSLSKSRRREP